MAANKLLSNLNLSPGEIVSASIELQTQTGTATNFRLQVVFFDNLDAVIQTVDGEAVDVIYQSYAASPDSIGPWYRSRIFNLTIPANTVSINVGYSYDTISAAGVISASRKPVLNKGPKPASYSRPSNDVTGSVSTNADTLNNLASTDFVRTTGSVTQTITGTKRVSGELLGLGPDFSGLELGTTNISGVYGHIGGGVYLRNVNNNYIGVNSANFPEYSGNLIWHAGNFTPTNIPTQTADLSMGDQDITDILSLVFAHGTTVTSTGNGLDIKSAASGSVSLPLRTSDNVIRGYVYANNLNQKGFLNESAGWQLKLNDRDDGSMEFWGSNTGNTNISVLEFMQSNGTLDGSIGVGSTGSRNVQLTCAAADLYLKGFTGIFTQVNNVTKLECTASTNHSYQNLNMQNNDITDVDTLAFLSGAFIDNIDGRTLSFDGDSVAVHIRLDTNGTTRGSIYADNQNRCGFLDEVGGWQLRLEDKDVGNMEFFGSATGNTNVSILSFLQSGGVRDGYVGVASTGNRNMYLLSDAGSSIVKSPTLCLFDVNGFTKFSATTTSNFSFQTLDMDGNDITDAGIITASGQIYSTSTATDAFRSAGGFSINGSAGQGYRLAGSDFYKMFMSLNNASNQVVDTLTRPSGQAAGAYNMYFRMGSSSNRGFVFYNDAASLTPLLEVASDGVVYCTDIDTSSDIKFKHNHKLITNAWDDIDVLDGWTYDHAKQNMERRAGSFAQDWERILPEVVSKNSNGELSVRSGGQIGFLVAWAKEAKEIITRQSERIERLERKLH